MATGPVLMDVFDTIFSRNAALVLGLTLCCVASVALYRLYLGPLAHIPGPKLAALTSLYAVYYDIIKGGKYIWEVENMHKEYGPIVRIRPNTIHINDAKFLDQCYGLAGKRRNRSKLHSNAESTPGSFISAVDHDLHRHRRSPVAPFFSKQSIRRLEPILHRCLTQILGILDKNAASQTPVRMNIVLNAATSDIITEYAFGNCWKNLEVPDLNERFFDVMSQASQMWHLASYLPWIQFFFMGLPPAVAAWLAPDMEVLIPHFAVLENQIEDVRKSSRDDGPLSIFQGMLGDKVPESEKTKDRLFSEARVILAAGTGTTAGVISNTCFFLLSNPKALKKLKKELEVAIPNASGIPTISQVETLPYLTATIQETLRINPPGAMRQERFAPDEDLVYTDDNQTKYAIPHGTNMAMTATLLCRNEELYPSHNDWRPERWLENPNLDRNPLIFSRGSRICIGVNLAWAEMYLVLAGIFRKYDLYDGTGEQKGPTLQLYETSRDDIDIVSEFAVPFVKPGSLGIRIVVRN